MANRLKFTRSRKRRFLAALALNANVSVAADAAGVTRRLAYAHREEDEEFRVAWNEAVERALDRLEQEAWRRAMDGVPEPVIQRGEWVRDPESGEKLVIKKYSDQVLLRLMSAHRPTLYSERRKIEGTIEHTGTVDHAHRIEFDATRLSAEQKLQLAELIRLGTPDPEREDPTLIEVLPDGSE